MRKINFFSTVFFLFLLVHASITRAQVTKTLNGTVSYVSGMSKTKFSTPNGDVVISLPQSLSGAMITGTVSTEPAGKTDKEKNRNLKELLKLIVNLDGQKIPVSATPANFDWLTHWDRQLRTPLELLDVSGGKVAEVSLPPVLSAPAILNSGKAPRLTTPSNVLVKGDALNVYTDLQFLPGEKFVLTDAKGQQFTIKPICLSSQQAVLNVPEGVVQGDCTVREEVWNQPLSGFRVSSASFRLIDIKLSSPNTNLRPGQHSTVLAVVIITDDKGEWTNPNLDSWFMSLRVDLRNLNPDIVTMERGNLQRVNVIDQKTDTIVNKEPATGVFRITRNIAGNTVGSFSVSATLHEDYSTSTDPFRPQLNVLKTPEDFNAWASALKKDLKQFAAVQINDAAGQAIKTNVQRALDNMPVCTTFDQLDESKAFAYSLIRPLDVPKGAATSWLSSYEAHKTVTKAIDNNLASNNEPVLIDYDVLKNGVEFISRVNAGEGTIQPYIYTTINNVQQLIEHEQNTGETKENLNQLNQAIHSLNSQTDQQLKTGSLVNNAWNLTDLLYSTYCINKRTRNGVDPRKSMIAYLDPDNKILKVMPEYQQQILNSLKAVPVGNDSYRINAITNSMASVSYNIQVAPLLLSSIYQGDWWAKYLIEEYIKKDTSMGKILSTLRDSTGTWYIFYKDAKCIQSEYSKGKTWGCIPGKEWDSKNQKDMATGFYETYTANPSARCLRGTDFCTEVYLITGVKNIYSDPKCTRLIRVETDYNFSCL